MRKFLVFLTMLCALAIPLATAQAFNPFEDVCNPAKNAKAGEAVACQEQAEQAARKDNPLTGKTGLFVRAEQLLALAAAIGAIIVIIVSGIQYTTTQGDPQKAAKARNAILLSLTGLVIIFLAQSIIAFVIARL